MESDNRRKLAIANLCRAYLHVHGFLTDVDNNKIHLRIMHWQDENEVEITKAQLYSADFTYDDNAKEELLRNGEKSKNKMKIEEVKLKRYFPSEGMALKITIRMYDYSEHKFVDSVSYTKEQGVIIDENRLISVEEVPMEEYNDWINNTPGLAVSAFSF